MANPRLRCAQGTATLAQLNYGTHTGVYIVAPSDRTITVVDGWLRNVGTNLATATAIAVTDGAGVVAFSCTIGTLDSNVLARVGASGFTNTNVGTALTGGSGLRICATVANATASTGVDYCVYYIVT